MPELPWLDIDVIHHTTHEETAALFLSGILNEIPISSEDRFEIMWWADKEIYNHSRIRNQLDDSCQFFWLSIVPLAPIDPKEINGHIDAINHPERPLVIHAEPGSPVPALVIRIPLPVP